MKQIVVTLILFSFFMLSSCMMEYYYKNGTYSSKSEAYSAQDSVLNNIKKSLYDPLSEPLSEKKLVVGIPTRETFEKTIVFRGQPSEAYRRSSKEFMLTQLEKEYLAMAEMVKEKKIYRDFEIIRTNGGHLQPSETEDVLYYFVTSAEAMSWYMADQKYGKQTMEPDRGIEGDVERMKGWLQSIQSLAIRE